MRKLFSPLLIITALVGISSCSTKFNIAAPYKNITVIYGLMDETDTAHYIRIEKAFLDQNKSAVVMAQNPDSSFYPESQLDVKMELIDPSGTIDSIYSLSRVDLNNEGYPKQTGAFFNSPNYAYKFPNTLNQTLTYRLVVNNKATGQVDSADAPIIPNDLANNFQVNFFQFVNNKLDFTTTGPYDNFNFAGTLPPNAKIIQLLLRFHYVDKDAITGATTPRQVDWYQGITPFSGPGFQFQILNASFYSFLRSAIGPPPSSNIQRLMDSCEIFVYAGSNDLYNYQIISQAQGGLTANDIKPNYTNIKGPNVLGLFTSRTFVSQKFQIDSVTIDSMMISPITSELNIRGTTYH
ncbi:MAG TPA: hypothetical protein VN721_03300 [Flavipsychrobacter sp.]|nr:hypothetical protein [Flavipsychrobacter sp.]